MTHRWRTLRIALLVLGVWAGSAIGAPGAQALVQLDPTTLRVTGITDLQVGNFLVDVSFRRETGVQFVANNLATDGQAFDVFSFGAATALRNAINAELNALTPVPGLNFDTFVLRNRYVVPFGTVGSGLFTSVITANAQRTFTPTEWGNVGGEVSLALLDFENFADITVVPLPAALPLTVSGLAVFAAMRRWRRRHA